MRRTVATPFSFRHLPLPYCLLSLTRSRTPRPLAIVSTPVTSPTISKSIRIPAPASRSTAAALAGGLARDAEVEAVLVGEVLHDAQEGLAVASSHDGGPGGVGVAVAGAALGAPRVEDFFEQPRLIDPGRDVEPRGVALARRLQVDEGDERPAALYVADLNCASTL